MGVLERKKRIATLGQLLRIVATLLVVGVAVLMTLSLFNVDIRPILTGAGIAGLAVGFGAQNLVRDVIAGFFLILEDQVRLGDVVSINGKSGLVEAIRLRTIVLRGHDGTVHVIPNGVINDLSNMTKDFSFAVLDIGIPYEQNVDTVIEVLKAVAADVRADPVHGPNILEPLEVLGIEAFNESSVQLRVRLKTVPIQQWNVARELRRRIKIAFEARGIDFPLRQMTLRMEGNRQPLPAQPVPTPEQV
jgi:small conductance mechanosensitive channel